MALHFYCDLFYFNDGSTLNDWSFNSIDWFSLFCIIIYPLILCFEHQCNTMHRACKKIKSSFIKYGSSWDSGRFMKNFHFDSICNITQDSQDLQQYNCACGFIHKSAVIKCHQLLSKAISINRKSHFDQLATA